MAADEYQRLKRHGRQALAVEELSDVEEFNHHRFFVDEKLTEYMKEPKNQLREYHGKEPEGIGPWGRFRTREWIED